MIYGDGRVVVIAKDRDNEFDLEAQQRLFAVHLQARRAGWTMARLLAAANLNLHLGHLAHAQEFADQLRFTLPDEAAVLDAAIIEARNKPLRTKKDPQ